MQRPFGITLLAVLALLSGLWDTLKGLAWLGVGGLAAILGNAVLPVAGAVVGFVALVFGMVALVTGLFSLVFAYGAFRLRRWAWSLGVATFATVLIWSGLMVLGPGILSDRWLSLALSAGILWYLYRPDIKQAFGRS